MTQTRYTLQQHHVNLKSSVKLSHVNMYHCESPASNIFPGHPYSKIIFIQKGQGQFYFGNQFLPVRENDLLLVNPDKQKFSVAVGESPLDFVILGIENFDDLDEKITLTNEMFSGLYEQDATQAGFQPGEEVRVIDLLYGAMLPSGAECCIALADTISGSEADFAELMNKKARKLGMENTHFCDSTGLHNPDHYSTVKDIAVLMKYCIKNDTFREIVETSRHSTGVTNIHPDGITYYSTMFKNLSDPTVTGGKILGGKTGYTSEAGHCLVSFAEIEGREYIFVSAGASGADGNTIPHIQDAVTVYNRVGAAVEAKMNDNNK